MQLAGDARHAIDHVVQVDGNADRARVVGNGARDGLTDPPRRVGAELEAAPPVEFLDRAQQPEVALLDQVDQRHAAVRIAPRDADHQAQVGVGQRLAGGLALAASALELVALVSDSVLGAVQPLGRLAAVFDRLRQAHLVVGREQRDATDLAQVQRQGFADAVAGRVLDGQSLGAAMPGPGAWNLPSVPHARAYPRAGVSSRYP